MTDVTSKADARAAQVETRNRQIALEYKSALGWANPNGYQNSRDNLTVSTLRGRAALIPAPVMMEFDYGDQHYRHRVNMNYYGDLKAGNVFANFHGGPGTGICPAHVTYFNTRLPDPKIAAAQPEVLDHATGLLLFQQPGAGYLYDDVGCDPAPNLQHQNTTLLVDSLVHAHDAMLNHGLKASTLAATGRSFGSMLAALSAAKYPKRICGIGLTGLFFGTQKDIDWVFQGAHERYAPEQSAQFKDFCAENGGDPDNFVASYAHLLTHSDPTIRKEALFHFYRLEYYTEQQVVLERSGFDAWQEGGSPCLYDQKMLRARMMVHFAENNFWLDPDDGIAPALEAIGQSGMPVVLGISGNDRLLPPEKRKLSFVENVFAAIRPADLSLIYTGDGVHVQTDQSVAVNQELRSRMMGQKGLSARTHIY